MKREYDFGKGKRGSVIPSEPGKSRMAIFAQPLLRKCLGHGCMVKHFSGLEINEA
jgi:hypothetical protein